MRAGLRGSVWASFALRAFGVAAALLLLAWVGARHVAAAPPVIGEEASVTAAVVEADASPPPLASVAVPPSPAMVPARASPEFPVYVNRASADELRRLPGVGAKRADQILALRQKMGRFARVEDLMRVKGIGRSAIKKWRPLVKLDTASPDGGS